MLQEGIIGKTKTELGSEFIRSAKSKKRDANWNEPTLDESGVF